MFCLSMVFWKKKRKKVQKKRINRNKKLLFYKTVKAFFTRKILIARWELNFFGVVAICCGVIIGSFFAINNLFPASAAPTQSSETITTQTQFNLGTFSETQSTNTAGGEVELAGGSGPDSTLYYKDIAINCNNFGRLYDWNGAMAGFGSSNNNPSGVQGVCPAGWHLPSQSEWEEFIMYMEDQEWNTGDAMKVTLNVWSNNSNATNASGFSALPAAYYDSGNDTWKGDNQSTAFWTATESGQQNTVYAWWLFYNNENFFSPLSKNLKVKAKLRYQQPLASAILYLKKKKAVFSKPQLITSGQFAVFYQKDICLGGGEII